MDRRMRQIKKTPVTLLALAITTALASPVALAQQAAPAASPTDLDTVTVTGYRQSLQK